MSATNAPVAPLDSNRLLTDSAVCALFGISRTTLWIWRKTRGFPTTIIQGDHSNAVRYRVSEVRQWARQNGRANKVFEL